jgi:1-acyl-sn-glycerol-3-phosphate acyltransferase
MAVLRSLVYAAIFYPATLLWVLAGIVGSLFGRGYPLAVVLSWVKLHHWLVEQVLGIHVRMEGSILPGPHLIAVKHQSMLETVEMVRLSNLPVPALINFELASGANLQAIQQRAQAIATWVARAAVLRALREAL